MQKEDIRGTGRGKLTNRSRKHYQYSTEGRKLHQNLAPVLVLILAILWYVLGKLLPVLVFTGTAPTTRQHQ